MKKCSDVGNRSLFDDITRNNHKGDENSEIANESIRKSKAVIQDKIINCILSCGQEGSTSQEAQIALGLTHESCSSRFSELHKEGVLKRIGKRPTKSGNPAWVHVIRDSE